MINLPTDVLLREAAKFSISLDNSELERFNIYANLLYERNKVMNLTAITDERGIVLKHFADSLSLLSVIDIKKGAKVIDVGTGAGFPGLVLLIARPDIQLTLLDSTNKKLAFISDVLTGIGLDAHILHARAEEAGQDPEYREKFDIATARAVATLSELCEYCLPFVKIGGIFASMKGSKVLEELEAAKSVFKLMGSEYISCKKLEIEDCGERNIIITKKVSHTSPKYPRSGSQIAKHPLV